VSIFLTKAYLFEKYCRNRLRSTSADSRTNPKHHTKVAYYTVSQKTTLM